MTRSTLSFNLEHFGKEAFFALALGILSTALLSAHHNLTRRNNKMVSASSPAQLVISHSPAITTSVVSAKDALTEDEMDALTSTWGSPAPGLFLRDRHGFTHFVVDVPTEVKSKGIVVLGHGLGTSFKVYEDAAVKLNAEGYTVVRYDFYNHGYSKYDVAGKDKWIEYSIDVFVDQLEDLLLHVSAELNQRVVGYIGHSTAGLVGPAANLRWSGDGARRPVIPKLILLAPAFYAKKPFMAKIADAIPGVLIGLMRCIPSARVIINDAYVEAGKIAFAHNDDGMTIYANEERQKHEQDMKLFGRSKGFREHPFISSGLVGINCYTLRGDLLPMQQKIFLESMTKTKSTSKILYLWGDRDKTVPYTDNIAQVRKWEEENDNLTVNVLSNMGHELPFEDVERCAMEAISFLEED